MGSAVVTTPSFEADSTQLWHAHLSHMSEKGIIILSKRGLLGSEGTRKLDFCDHSVFGKQKGVSFSTATYRSKGTLDYIHSDLWGSSRVPFIGGKRCMPTFVHDFSQRVWVYFL